MTHKSLLCRRLQRFCPTYATLTLFRTPLQDYPESDDWL
jgi:hypothetical protein